MTIYKPAWSEINTYPDGFFECYLENKYKNGE